MRQIQLSHFTGSHFQGQQDNRIGKIQQHIYREYNRPSKQIFILWPYPFKIDMFCIRVRTYFHHNRCICTVPYGLYLTVLWLLVLLKFSNRIIQVRINNIFVSKPGRKPFNGIGFVPEALRFGSTFHSDLWNTFSLVQLSFGALNNLRIIIKPAVKPRYCFVTQCSWTRMTGTPGTLGWTSPSRARPWWPAGKARLGH